ncbi:uncharacterized protein LOC113346281 [Papaver somniferum]|uniref:uncharacterized protein LOC113346281 n=1 Tax=Papaver somniferum TaxID=3469 RepID=UPI000E7006F6|nr:uncharacterized protein LOC113346281 [Papaver somniferum]
MRVKKCFGFLVESECRGYLQLMKRSKGDLRIKIQIDSRREKYCAMGTWVFSVAGALLAIPIGIKSKSLGPLVFFGTTGTMLDIIMGVTACEREHAERKMKLLEEQQKLSSTDDAAFVVESETSSL